MSKRKANIRPDLVGEIFSDGKSYFELVKCGIEPLATFRDITKPEQSIITLPISEFSDFVQLKPVRPIEKPRKPRADSGKTHKKQASKPSDVPTVKIKAKKQRGTKLEPEIADKKGDNLTIHVPTGMEGDTAYLVTIRDEPPLGSGFTGQGETLVEALRNCLSVRGGEIPDFLSDYEKKCLQGILDAGE